MIWKPVTLWMDIFSDQHWPEHARLLRALAVEYDERWKCPLMKALTCPSAFAQMLSVQELLPTFFVYNCSCSFQGIGNQWYFRGQNNNEHSIHLRRKMFRGHYWDAAARCPPWTLYVPISRMERQWREHRKSVVVCVWGYPWSWNYHIQELPREGHVGFLGLCSLPCEAEALSRSSSPLLGSSSHWHLPLRAVSHIGLF